VLWEWLTTVRDARSEDVVTLLMNISVSCHKKSGIELSMCRRNSLFSFSALHKKGRKCSTNLHLHTNFYSAIWQETWTLEGNKVLWVLSSGKEEELLNNNAWCLLLCVRYICSWPASFRSIVWKIYPAGMGVVIE